MSRNEEENIFINFKNIIIDKNGICNSNNQNKCKITFFGIEKNPGLKCGMNSENELISPKSNVSTAKEGVLVSNDITRPKINKTMALFYINYDVNTKKYFLKTLSRDIYFALNLSGEDKYYFKYDQIYYIKLGRAVLSVSLDSKDDNIRLKIRKCNGLFEEKLFSFNKSKTPITLGRSLCSVNILHSSISKIHACIDYDCFQNKYFIIDKQSTNGTHLLLNEDKIIFLNGKMTFFLGDKSFIIEEKYI